MTSYFSQTNPNRLVVSPAAFNSSFCPAILFILMVGIGIAPAPAPIPAWGPTPAGRPDGRAGMAGMAGMAGKFVATPGDGPLPGGGRAGAGAGTALMVIVRS